MAILAIGDKVLAGMRGNPAFSDPPVRMEILEQTLDEFSLAIQAQPKGGTLATAIRNNGGRKVMELCPGWPVMSKTNRTMICRLCSRADFRRGIGAALKFHFRRL